MIASSRRATLIVLLAGLLATTVSALAHRDFASLPWHSFLSGEQMETLIAPARALSIADLVRYLRQMRGSAGTPAVVISDTVIPGNSTSTSDYVYTKPRLVQ